MTTVTSVLARRHAGTTTKPKPDIIFWYDVRKMNVSFSSIIFNFFLASSPPAANHGSVVIEYNA
jgi:hypothetical protein